MLYKLGAVSYLNALPLIHDLKEKPRLEPPATLAQLLKMGEVDIATVPIVTWFENPSYTLIPGVCIGSHGRVLSVKLFFTSENVTLRNVTSLSLDTESRTSILLLKILLQFKYGRNLSEITFHQQPSPWKPPTGTEPEAKLLIGDKAMQENPKTPSVDLGEEWTSWTGLPFVFAAWISRSNDVGERVISELNQARDQGVGNLDQVVGDYLRTTKNAAFSGKIIRDYLGHIVYILGEKEKEGMELFRKYFLSL